LAALTIAVACGDIGTSTLVDFTGATTYAACVVEEAVTVCWVVVVAGRSVNAIVHVIADVISIHVEETMSVANTEDIDDSNTRIINVTNAVVVEIAKRTAVLAVHDSVIVAVVQTIVACFVHVTSSILVHVDAVIHIVANSVHIGVIVAVSATNANGVKLGSVTIAVTRRDV
jgi:hypothetical protein